MTRVAPRLAALLAGRFAGNLPVRLRAWDGSEAGPKAAPVVVLRSPRALRRLLWQPGELGLAQAYIAGDLDIDGDLADGLSRVWRSVREHGPAPGSPGPRQLARTAVTALRLGALGPRPPAPGAPQARLRGTLHSTVRDRAAISHHYDLSNDWYALLLDESMAYSCGYWTRPADPPTDRPTPSGTNWSWSAANWTFAPAPASWTSAAAGAASRSTRRGNTTRRSPRSHSRESSTPSWPPASRSSA